MLRRATTVRLLLPVLLASAGFLVPAVVHAQVNRDAGIGIYLTEARGNMNCNTARSRAIDCEDRDALTEGELYRPYYAYLCVFNGDPSEGIAGFQLGIDYDGASGLGVEINSWTRCSDLDFPTGGWPGAGSSNRITWSKDTNCQENEPGGPGSGVTAIGGFFYVIAYSDDVFAIKTWVGENEEPIKVANCESAETALYPEQGGNVAFSEDGTAEGKMPCLTREFIEATVGEIKNKFGTGR